MILVLGLIAVIAGFSVPIYSDYQRRNEVASAQQIVITAIETAQVSSQGTIEDTTWGLKINGNTMIVFKGATYVTRDTTRDISFDIPSHVAVSGINEIVFAKMTGITTNTGTITLSNSNSTKTITVNTKGAV
jgi:type II secretory pathway pseudopilin PulG